MCIAVTSPIGAVVDALHRLALGVVVAVAEAGAEAEVLLLGELGGLDHRRDAGDVHRDRLLAEDVLAGLDRGAEVQRPEARRRAEQHHVDALEELLVAVEAVETAVRGDVDLGGDVADLDLRFVRLASRRSMKASHMATSLTFGSARRASLAAPVPRPPQPTSPTRSVSSPAA